MKRIFLSLLLAACIFTGSRAQTLSSTCQYSTCIPVRNFGSADNAQIYGAIISGFNKTLTVTATSGTIITGTVVISGTPNVHVTSGTVSISGTPTVAISGTPTVAISGTASIGGNVGGYTVKIMDTLDVSGGAYSANDNIGGVNRVRNAFRLPSISRGVLNDIEIYDKSAQAAALVIDFWQVSPNGTFTDNAAEVLNDPLRHLGQVVVAPGDYVTTGTVSRANITGLGIIVTGDPVTGDATGFYYTVLTTGSPTYTSGANTLFMKFGILQD